MILVATMNNVADAWLAAIVRASWQGGLALGLVWALLRLWPRISPRIQCWLWRLAYLKLLTALLWGTPITLAVLPPPSVTQTNSMPAMSAAEARTTDGAPEALPATASVSTPAPASSASGTAASAIPTLPHLRSAAPTAAAALALWLALALWQLAWVCSQWRVTRRVNAKCRPLWEGDLLSACARLSYRLGLRRTPGLMACEGVDSPLLLGVVYPSIVLPETMVASCGPKEQDLILAHELAHIRRRDLLWAWLPILARVLFCFHPLVWLALRELNAAQEMDCDAVALEITQASVSEYGNLLIQVAGQRRPGSQSGLSMVGMANSYHTLKRRLSALKSMSPVSPVRLSLTGGALLVLGLAGIVPWRVAAQIRPEGPLAPSRRPAAPLDLAAALAGGDAGGGGWQPTGRRLRRG